MLPGATVLEAVSTCQIAIVQKNGSISPTEENSTVFASICKYLVEGGRSYQNDIATGGVTMV